jgi:polysaccharide deacetylase family protein (PEP-CTERM system associated)
MSPQRFGVYSPGEQQFPDRSTLRVTTDHNVEVVDALSVDLEDYYQVEAFASTVPRSSWPEFQPRVDENTCRVLELFARHKVKGTFFVLGWIAERNPSLIRQIVGAGHEIACHGYDHQRVTSLNRDEFRADLRRARNTIEDACGVRVIGYRAPTFSITRRNLWALEVLAEEGFLYDSSIFPIRHDNYGVPDAPRFSHRRNLACGLSIFEFPISTVRIAGINLPATGGGYLRLLPMTYMRWAIDRIHKRDRQSVILYFHPWEIDPQQPRLQAGWKSRFRHYFNLGKTADRLSALLSNGRFEPMINLTKRLDLSRPEASPSQEPVPVVSI